mmetsp:Transcript_10073/g.21646  ORF Transcript_10073/g.21646 Transcript_10073/m.21646 type:complete len:716 (+) Transcript_10073:79-2226(+)
MARRLQLTDGSEADNMRLLPILIIPGFMSSGLEVKDSNIRPEWNGERIWLNLQSIGISAMYFGNAKKQRAYSSNDLDTDSDADEDDKEEHRQARFKSSWLEHMMLSSDNESDPPGVKVRAISGLEGVNYLTPGAITSHVSYVFGPVIDYLESKGYNPKDGKTNLMASPYDWRLAPGAMEKRDKYFTNTIGVIEELYHNNDSTPVVLLCHSLGCKVAHYLLNFALDTRGQEWIDKYVHTYMPIGGPHLGAPKAMRGLICGDKMGLDTFMNDEEALALSRSLGSCSWLVPSVLPEGVPVPNYILPHGVLEISLTHALDVDPLVNKRTGLNNSQRYQLEIHTKDFGRSQKNSSQRAICTQFHRISPDLGPNVVVFTDKISFATETKPHLREKLHFVLKEPGFASAKVEGKKRCCNPMVWCLCCLCIPCMLIYKLLCGIIRGATLTAEAIAISAGSSATLAFSEGTKIPKAVWKGKEVTVDVPMYHTDDYAQSKRCWLWRKKPRKVNLSVKLRWTAFNQRRSYRKICSSICSPMESAVQLPFVNAGGENYEEFSGYDLAEREGLEKSLRFIKQAYDDDEYGPRHYSSMEPPPIKRVHAIYGVNLPTEVGCVYSRQDTCLSDNVLQSLYLPDEKAKISKNTGYKMSGGLIMETPNTAQKVSGGIIEKSGDGTVPYWSLAHAKTWNSKECRVTVKELDKAPHREILNDTRLHEGILNYVRQ